MALKKDDAINSIQEDFESLANVVLQQLDALDSLITSGELKVPNDLHKSIIENEKCIDKMEVKLSEKIVNTIVLYQPVAYEIRKLIACYRMIISLERIGDLVVSITSFIKKIKNKDVYDHFSELISNMMILSISMVKNSLLAFINSDMDLAIWTIRNDSVVNDLNHKMLKKAANKGKLADEKKNFPISFINMKEMVSNIERIGDHAANIAEAAIYSFEGKDIRHHRLDELEDDKKTKGNE